MQVIWTIVVGAIAGSNKPEALQIGWREGAGKLTYWSDQSAEPVMQITADAAMPVDYAGMPVYLSFLICALSGGTCHVTIPVERPFIGISACQMEGMTMLPQWQEQHPGWTIKRIRCSIGSRPHDEEAA